MKGLRKYLTPFAPDQSGAVSVLFSLSGLIVIIDAGGCTGNICGFDEPRWQTQKCAVFSAGLRDMDAIMGRDDRLIAKILKVVDRFDLEFIALIGTPVPAVIGTDYKGLARVLEKKTGLPVLPINTNGMALYDEGVEKAYSELIKAIVPEEETFQNGVVSVIGLTPLDYTKDEMDMIQATLSHTYKEVRMLGMSSIDDFKHLRQSEKIIVASPAGLKAAKLIKRRYHIPFEMLKLEKPNIAVTGSKVLILHQQVYANAIRESLNMCDKDIRVGTYFKLNKTLKEDHDIHFDDEDDLMNYIKEHNIDTVIGDMTYQPLIGQAKLIPLHHTAVSGDD